MSRYNTLGLALGVVLGGIAGFTYDRQHQLDRDGRHTTGKVDIRYEIRGMGISPTTESLIALGVAHATHEPEVA